MSLRNLWTLSAAAVLFSGCYFWNDPPFPADDTEDTGSQTADTESSQTDSESIDTETEDTDTTESDTREPECTSGVCCDISTKTLRSSTFACNSVTEYRCDGSGCGADAQKRTVVQYCSGSSDVCDGEVAEEAWTTEEECATDEICETDSSNYSKCNRCTNGCLDGACCACATGPCCDGCNYLPSSDVCDTNDEYRCDGNGCGADAQKRGVTTYCSGTSASCDGETHEQAWTTLDDCTLDEICETDNSNYAFCKIDSVCDCDNNGNWYDPSSGLCWQNPPPESRTNWYRASGTYHAVRNPDTVDYCGDLVQGGYSDWRLPNIDELISLIRGCKNGTPTGDLSTSLCEMTPAGCAEADSCSGSTTCSVCFGIDVPEWGCYWDPGLGGTCGVYWSSSSASSNDGDFGWCLLFGNGNVGTYNRIGDYYARCVRGGP